jgi:adenylate kinase family enzyme
MVKRAPLDQQIRNIIKYGTYVVPYVEIETTRTWLPNSDKYGNVFINKYFPQNHLW